MASETFRVITGLRRFTSETVVRITLDVIHELVPDTPIKTGWARSNWVPQIGSSRDETTGSQESVDYSAQETAVADVILNYILPAPIYISNNVPYINKLNDGSSSQAPSGFVQTAISRAIRGAI